MGNSCFCKCLLFPELNLHLNNITLNIPKLILQGLLQLTIRNTMDTSRVTNIITTYSHTILSLLLGNSCFCKCLVYPELNLHFNNITLNIPKLILHGLLQLTIRKTMDTSRVTNIITTYSHTILSLFLGNSCFCKCLVYPELNLHFNNITLNIPKMFLHGLFHITIRNTMATS